MRHKEPSLSPRIEVEAVSEQDAQELRTRQRTEWLGPVRGIARRFAFDEQQLLDQLEKQRYECPVCDEPFRERTLHVHIDLDGEPRGLLCGWCLRYVKAIEHNPLLGPQPKRYPIRKTKALIYLGCFNAEQFQIE